MSLVVPDCQKTEYGTVPSDWLIGELRNILAFQCGAPFASLHFRKDGIGIRLIRNRDLKSNDDIVFYDGIYESSYVVKNGDVLVSMDGDFIPCCWNNGEALLNQRVGRVLTKGGNLAKYLYYILVTPLRRKQEGTGATTVKHLSHSDVEKLVVPYTLNIQEQRAIATALSDVDALIEAKTALLEKKRAIKQGAMQELLTGKRRLPGFSVTPMKNTEIGEIPEDWEVKTLGRSASIARGGSPRPIESYLTTSPDGVNWIKIGDVSPGAKYIEHTGEKILSSGAKHSRKVKPGDLLLSNSMSYGRPCILSLDGCIHDGWLTIADYESDFYRDYLYYALSSSLVLSQYEELAAGTGVKNLNKKIVAGVQVPCPCDIGEQKAIASVLSDMDDELVSLERELEKLGDLKQGMMQNLLTGRIRLV